MNWINKFFEKTKGSISLFLSIILVPTLALGGLLIDMANRNMSKALIESAGELAASSALADYDAVLEDVYGLFAMSQDNAELQENVTEYIEDTLSAAGILSGQGAKSEVGNMVKETFTTMMGSIDAEDVKTGFINADISDITAKGIEDSALSTPAVMKNQIVEFMKYRGVEVVAQDLLSTIKQFKTLNDKTDVAEKKMDTEEKLEDVSDAAQELYNAIYELEPLAEKARSEYESMKNNNKWGISLAYGVTNEGGIVQYTNVAANSAALNLYNAFTKICDYGNSVDLADKARYSTCKVEYYYEAANNVYRFSVYGATGKQTDTSAMTIMSIDNIESTLNDKLYWIDYYLDALKDNIDSIHNTSIYSWDVIVQNNAISAFEAYSCFIDNMISYTTLEDSIYEKAAFDSDEGTAEEMQEIMKWREVLWKYYGDNCALMNETNFMPLEYDVTGDISEMAKKYIMNVEDAKYTIGINILNAQGCMKSYYESICEILGKTKDGKLWKDLIKGKENYMDYCIGLCEKVKSSLTELNSANDAYSGAIDTYENKNESDAYSEQMQSDSDSIKSTFTNEQVDELEKQLKSLKKFLEDEKAALEGISLFECELSMTEDYSDKFSTGKKFLNAGRDVLSNADTKIFTQNGMDIYNYALLYKNAIVGKLTPTYCTEDSYIKKIGSAITLDSGGQIGVPPFWLYLQQTYQYTGEESTAQTDDVKSMQGKTTSDVDTTAASVDPEVTEILADSDGEGCEEIKNDGTNSGILKQFKEYAELVKGTIGVCSTIVNLEGEEIRDDLLVTTYIFEDFSNFSNTFSKNKDPENSITGLKFSAENNAMFGYETEYILYGNSNEPLKNVNVAKGNIFAIRFISNSIFAISDGTVNAYTLSPALAIQAATLGVFPYKVAQVVLDLCLALAESIYDTEQIMKGNEIDLFKTINSWVMQPSGIAKVITQEAQDLVTAEANELSGKLQQILNNEVDDIKSKVDGIAGNVTKDIQKTLEAYVEEAMSAMGNIIASKLTEILSSVYTGSAPESIGIDYVKSELTNTLTDYVDEAENSGSFNDTVATFIKKHIPGMIDTVVKAKTDDGKSIESIINEVNAEYQKMVNVNPGESVSIEFKAEYFTDVLDAVSKSLSKYLYGDGVNNKGIFGEITETVEGWTSDVAEEVKGTINGYITDATETLTAEANEAIADAINSTLGEYFPAEADWGENIAGASDGSALGDMLKFGYTDYLRLFIFLKMNVAEEENGVLKRIGDVIKVNRLKGLKTYYTDNGTEAPKSYDMSKAYTYVSISGKVTVKPTILGSTFFSSMSEKNILKSNFWDYTYSTTAGY